MEGSHSAYDRAAALRRLRGNESLLRDLAIFFHEDAFRQLDALKRAIELKQFTSIKRATHSLHGLATTFDGFEVQHAAARVQEAVDAGSVTELRNLLRALEECVQRLDDALKRERGH